MKDDVHHRYVWGECIRRHGRLYIERCYDRENSAVNSNVICLSSSVFLNAISTHYLLLRLNKTNPTSIPLVHDANFVGFFVTEDVKVMVDVVKCEDRFFNRDWLTQVETKTSFYIWFVRKSSKHGVCNGIQEKRKISATTHLFTFVTTAWSGSMKDSSFSLEEDAASSPSSEFKTSARFSPMFGPPW